MTTNTPLPGFDFSALDLNRLDTQEIRRTAELVRSEYIGAAMARLGQRITAAYRSAADLLGYAQRMNQAARL
mgnify:CR=1 FL=1